MILFVLVGFLFDFDCQLFEFVVLDFENSYSNLGWLFDLGLT